MFWSSLAHASPFPIQGATFSSKVDALYSFLYYSSLISSILVIGGMVYFAIKYRRKAGEKSAYISHSTILEFLWSFVPFVIFMVVFAWGWIVYHDLRTAPKDAFEVLVTGQKWSWSFTYKSGRKSAELYVPVHTPIRLVMGSNDVIHSFYVPAFRVKQDVVPGRYTTLWFESDKVGEYQVFCAEYCGEQHSGMLTKIHVLSREDFDQWLQDDPYKGLSLAEVGQKVFTQNCAVCHNATAVTKIGPGLLGLFGKTREFDNADPVVADEAYIRESIRFPEKKHVKGIVANMTPFPNLSDDEMIGIIEYIKTLK